MGIRREWIDWSKPALEQAADWLIACDDARDVPGIIPGVCDLRHILCLLPGQRAGRILLALMIKRCEAQGLQLIPPRILTPGALMNEITRDQPLANTSEITLAWIAALRSAPSHLLAPLLPTSPEENDVLQWHSLACTIAKLHEELAGAQLTFAAIADQAERLEMFGEGMRWRALEHVHNLYRDALKTAGLIDPHHARAAAIQRYVREGWPGAPPQIVLIGVAELNNLQRLLISSAGDNVTALIHGPQDSAHLFDECGCVVPQAWTDRRVEINSDQIISADRPDDQAQYALRAIADFKCTLRPAQITIGLGDESLASSIEHAAEWADVHVHWAGGRTLQDSPPCTALQAITNFLADPEPRFAELAVLLRHCDIERWLWKKLRNAGAGVAEWISLLDRYFADHLHERCTGEWLGDEQMCARLDSVFRAVSELIAPLRMDKTRFEHSERAANVSYTLGHWAQPILHVLTNLYGDLAPGTQADQMRLAVCESIRDALADWIGAPPELQPQVNASEAIAMLLSQISKETLPSPAGPDQIEMLGWLELHLDPAPALLIAGFNEGYIPSSTSADAFLPDSLRQKLGLSCNFTRYARDAYIFEAILNCRESLRIITGRRSQRGDALTPSRLLLTCDDQTLVHRVRVLCDEKTAAAKPAAMGLDHLAATKSKFIVPELPADLPQREYMTITEFRSYLACPYRYALERLLRLETLEDEVSELDPLQFGVLAHDVLCEFGSDDAINCFDDPQSIERFLLASSQRLAQERFGKSPLAAVRVQLARLQQRLRSFAQLQANLCRDGWRIMHCEMHFGLQRERRDDGSLHITADTSVPLDIPGEEPMPLHGKIDRIDFNARTGQWRIIDYKTSESATSPHKSHTGSEKCDSIAPDAWKDLQLPLYHFLATRCGKDISGDIELAYICLPKQADGAAVKAARWNPEQVQQAIDVARDVVRRIRAQEFPLNRQYTGFDNFARICQTSAFMEEELVEAE